MFFRHHRSHQTCSSAAMIRSHSCALIRTSRAAELFTCFLASSDRHFLVVGQAQLLRKSRGPPLGNQQTHRPFLFEKRHLVLFFSCMAGATNILARSSVQLRHCFGNNLRYACIILFFQGIHYSFSVMNVVCKVFKAVRRGDVPPLGRLGDKA